MLVDVRLDSVVESLNRIAELFMLISDFERHVSTFDLVHADQVAIKLVVGFFKCRNKSLVELLVNLARSGCIMTRLVMSKELSK